ncbi:DUF2163 domain-containing protein [Pseudaestuariivita sp.]|uniref:DUF2163 domain-containing protein n=1 Tax=Pseudaestuariivita sp. TaxID=2211669 RepID=UPI004058AAD4
MSALLDHLQTGATHVCHAWEITRTDGMRLGFTDHDRNLVFDGLTFRADSGLSAMALQQSTGLSVDNTEAMGALSGDAISEADIDAGRFDRATVTAWRVQWDNTDARQVIFRGMIGDVTRGKSAFQAEIRGLTDNLNQPIGRVYQKPCSAVLGDKACKVDLTTPGYRHKGALRDVEEGRILHFDALDGFDAEWFQRGTVTVETGAAQGLTAMIKEDRQVGATRQIELWETLGAPIAVGDEVTLTAGCDKRFETCRLKFANVLNFQGFPDIPEDDWVLVHPTRAQSKAGGSRR